MKFLIHPSESPPLITSLRSLLRDAEPIANVTFFLLELSAAIITDVALAHDCSNATDARNCGYGSMDRLIRLQAMNPDASEFTSLSSTGGMPGLPLDCADDHWGFLNSWKPSARKRERYRRRIFTGNGFWWFSDPDGKGTVRLDPLFFQCRWNVGRLGILLGVGDRTLSRVIEESVGLSGKRWLRQVRIVTACHLLRESGKIEPLANQLGFQHHTDFSREFKKLVGVSPSEFVRAERARSKPPNH